MLNCNFYLANPNRDYSTINMWIYHKPFAPFVYGVVLSAGIRIKIPTYTWDKKKQEAIVNKLKTKDRVYTNSILALNMQMNNLKNIVSQICLEAVKGNIICSNDYLRTKINESLSITPKEIIKQEAIKEENERLFLSKFYEDLIRQMENGSLLQAKNGKKYTKDTINSHIQTYKATKFFDKINKTRTYFSSISQQWYNEFILFLTEPQEYIDVDDPEDKEKNYSREELSLNTIGGKHIKNLKFVLRHAFEKDITDKQEYNKAYFIKPSCRNALL